MNRKILGFLAIGAAMTAAPAHATWLEASSAHFVIDADADEKSLHDFAQQLERFDYTLRQIYGVAPDQGKVAERVHVYATTLEMVQRLEGSPSVLAFYDNTSDGPVIFAPSIAQKGKGYPEAIQVVLLHEYSHYFMWAHFHYGYPYWYQEAFAEFNSNVAFNADGSVTIGLPDNLRYDDLHSFAKPTVEHILQPSDSMMASTNSVVAIYARGWLLLHMLMLDPARRGQVATYLTDINKGMTSLQAGKAAFGDLDKLQAELNAYLKDNKLKSPLRVPAAASAFNVMVTPLSAGVSAMLTSEMWSRRPIGKTFAEGLVGTAAGVAKSQPGSARVQTDFSRLAYRAGAFDKADAAADAALVADPSAWEAMVMKGRIAAKHLTDSKSTDPVAWKAARAWYLKANHLDPDLPQPLLYYGLSFHAAKEKLTPSAVKALQRAEVLAPEIDPVRWELAGYYLGEGADPAAARQLLAPLAYRPHGSKDKNPSRDIIEAIDAGKSDQALTLFKTEDDPDKAKKKS